jgi:DNA-binding IclR family transcriptional regulator
MVSQPRPALTSRTRTTVEQLDRELAGIRSRGVSVSRGGSVPGILGLAAPVWGANRELVAAVHVSALQGSLSPQTLRDVTAELLKSAQAIETELSRSVRATA